MKYELSTYSAVGHILSSMGTRLRCILDVKTHSFPHREKVIKGYSQLHQMIPRDSGGLQLLLALKNPTQCEPEIKNHKSRSRDDCHIEKPIQIVLIINGIE